MKCPICDNDMQSGKATVEPSSLGMLASLTGSGVSSALLTHLYFTPSGGTAEAILDYGVPQEAFCCRDCKTVVVLGKPKGSATSKEGGA
jgi:hypothetical protein